MADDNTKNFLKSVDSVVEETERAFEQRDQIAEVYNQWAVDQGADPDELNAAVLEDILVENGVIPAADDHTVNIGWGRQIHAPGRFEIQLFYDIAANTIANELEQHGFSTTVRPFTLEKDPWMNYNTEKRSYTYPTMMVGGEVTDYHPAEAQNSRRLDAHEVALTEQERATLEHFFETDMDDVETLPELHDAMDPDGLIDGGRDDLPDFRGVYNAVLDRLAESQVYPEHILVEPGTTDAMADDQAVKLR
ncbi:MAG: hypothetical protein SVW77_02235, partial [Candidatus Nanohaloarchaea archaeon]|nr:hypothetical protein [Candidatus Nanohaloarchaea archaeon]